MVLSLPRPFRRLQAGLSLFNLTDYDRFFGPIFHKPHIVQTFWSTFFRQNRRKRTWRPVSVSATHSTESPEKTWPEQMSHHHDFNIFTVKIKLCDRESYRIICQIIPLSPVSAHNIWCKCKSMKAMLKVNITFSYCLIWKHVAVQTDWVLCSMFPHSELHVRITHGPPLTLIHKLSQFPGFSPHSCDVSTSSTSSTSPSCSFTSFFSSFRGSLIEGAECVSVPVIFKKYIVIC